MWSRATRSICRGLASCCKLRGAHAKLKPLRERQMHRLKSHRLRQPHHGAAQERRQAMPLPRRRRQSAKRSRAPEAKSRRAMLISTVCRWQQERKPMTTMTAPRERARRRARNAPRGNMAVAQWFPSHPPAVGPTTRSTPATGGEADNEQHATEETRLLRGDADPGGAMPNHLEHWPLLLHKALPPAVLHPQAMLGPTQSSREMRNLSTSPRRGQCCAHEAATPRSGAAATPHTYTPL